MKKLIYTLFLFSFLIFVFQNSIAQQDGTFDESFGVSGIVRTTFSNSDDYCYDAVLDSMNHIVMVGNTSTVNNQEFAIIKLNENGLLDTTDITWKKILHIDLDDDFARAVTIDGNNNIIVAGYSRKKNTDDNYDFAMIRLNEYGKIDSSFGIGGIVRTPISNYADYCYDVEIDSKGRIIAVGNSDNGSNNDICIVRYNTDGTLDNTFSGDGILSFDIAGEDDFCTSVAIRNNKIIFGGYTHKDRNFNYSVGQVTENGSLDSTFSKDGIFTISFDKYDTKYKSDDFCKSITFDKDGNIYAGGYTTVSQTWQGNSFGYSILKLSETGNIDTSFATEGLLISEFNKNDEYINKISVFENKIITTGYRQNLNDLDIVVRRFNTDGMPDEDFGFFGRVYSNISRDDYNTSHIILPTGSIIATGYSKGGNYNEFSLVAFDINGEPLKQFANQGKSIQHLKNKALGTPLMAIDASNRILLNGQLGYWGDKNPYLARYNSKGQLDPMFNFTGKTTIDFNEFDLLKIKDLMTDTKNRVLTFASFLINDSHGMMISCYREDGTVDSEFGNNGMIFYKTKENYNLTNIIVEKANDSNDFFAFITLEYDDSNNNKLYTDLTVIKFHSNGVIDPSFGTNGIFNIGELFNGACYGESIDIDNSDNLIISLTYGEDWPFEDFKIIRLTSAGLLDYSFGNNGVISILEEFPILKEVLGNTEPIGKVKTDFEDKIVFVGNKTLRDAEGYASGEEKLFIIKFNRYGAKDLTFGNNGISFPIDTCLSCDDKISVRDFVIAPDNNIYVVGDAPRHFILLALEQNGKVKDQFYNNGLIRHENLGTRSSGSSIAIDNEGKLIVAGNITTIPYKESENILLKLNLTTPPVSVDPNNSTIQDFSLSQNFPNPFNPTTTIKYSIPVVDANFVSTTKGNESIRFVQLKVYDVLGKEVATLVNEKKLAGNYKVTFDGSNLTSGIYFYSLTSGNFRQTKKLILLK